MTWPQAEQWLSSKRARLVWASAGRPCVEWFEERAAIGEHSWGSRRPIAENKAYLYVIEMLGSRPRGDLR